MPPACVYTYYTRKTNAAQAGGITLRCDLQNRFTFLRKNKNMENQLRTEINQIILKLPENRLKPVLAYLRQVENATEEQANTANLVKKIFEEDAELLKKLAQ